MREAPRISWLEDGRGLRLIHGPIDVVVCCRGRSSACRQAYLDVQTAFADVLHSLVAELTVLRCEIDNVCAVPVGPIGREMWNRCVPYATERVTPMAAVAGAVADHLLAVAIRVGGLRKAWVNNGGDIAVFLADGQQFECGMVSQLATGNIDGSLLLRADNGVGGVATSGSATRGQGGRSYSLGIADAVTVLAATAAAADVAATLIANRVDLPNHRSILRVPAIDIEPDSDLNDRLVVTGVGALSANEVDEALERGVRYAESCLQRGLIAGAVLSLRGRRRMIGTPSEQPAPGLERSA